MFVCLVGRLVGWLVGQLVGWVVGWLVGRSVGWSVTGTPGYSVGRSLNLTLVGFPLRFADVHGCFVAQFARL